MAPKLPTTAAKFIDATQTQGVEGVLSCFADSAIFHRYEVDYEGEALKAQVEQALLGAKTSIVPQSVEDIDGQTLVRVSVSGEGIPAPLLLDMYFTFNGDKIQRLVLDDCLRGTPTMTAVYAMTPNWNEPLSVLRVGKRMMPEVPEGHVRVKMTSSCVNWHDLWTIRGIGGEVWPRIIGCEGCGILDDGTEVIIYPGIGNPDWRGDETLDPDRSVLSEDYPGTLAEYVVIPQRNAIPLPEGLSAQAGGVIGIAWLTAYRCLFTKSELRSGQKMLVQGASGGVNTALIQMGKAAGMRVWVTGRTAEKRALAEELGAHRTFKAGEPLPEQVDAVFDTVGEATWDHTMASVKTGGTIINCGMHGGGGPKLNLQRLLVDQVQIKGVYFGTLEEFKDLISFIVTQKLEPRIGKVLPLARAIEGVQDLWEGNTLGKIAVTF